MAVKEWDRIRFATGEVGDEADNPVWQGFYAGNNMAGIDAWVTADTMRRFVDAIEAEMDEWNRIHNPLSSQNDLLAFGGSSMDVSVQRAPDGVTPVYLLSGFALNVVQRWDPLGGKAYEVKRGNETVETRRWGEWVNEGEVYGIPKPQGFVINPEYDTPFEGPNNEVDEDAAAAFRENIAAAAAIGMAKSDPEVVRQTYAAIDSALAVAAAQNAVFPYYDHNGQRTADPRCELGLCVECINDGLSRGKVPAIPSLSTHNPRFLHDSDYRERVRQAWLAIGVQYRED